MFTKTFLLFIIYMGVTTSYSIQELIIGLFVSYFVATVFMTDKKVHLILEIKKYIRFIPYFLKDLIKSNIEIAKIVLNPKLPINPGIMKFHMKLTSDYDKLLLANSITLTPGTITMEVKSQDIYIHILDLNQDKGQLQVILIDEKEKIIDK